VPTEVEIPDEMAAHPWITRDFADNAIESPARTKARHEKIAAESEKAKAEAARAIREAEDAMRRATGAAQTLAQQDAKVVDDLNTPINQLASRSGIDIGKPINLDSPDVQAALNTPVNVLQANGGKAPEAPEEAEPQVKEDLPNSITFGMKKTATKK
jgi:type II secretory pathway pseudopilin PulG